MTTPSDELYELKGKDLETFGFSRVRDLAYDAVQVLWRRRKAEGWSQQDLAAKIDRDPGWVSKNLRGSGNWTFRTFGTLLAALGGEAQITVRAIEDPIAPRKNWHAYAGYEPETSVLCPLKTATPVTEITKPSTKPENVVITAITS